MFWHHREWCVYIYILDQIEIGAMPLNFPFEPLRVCTRKCGWGKKRTIISFLSHEVNSTPPANIQWTAKIQGTSHPKWRLKKWSAKVKFHVFLSTPMVGFFWFFWKFIRRPEWKFILSSEIFWCAFDFVIHRTISLALALSVYISIL